jgi:hypothetical protein
MKMVRPLYHNEFMPEDVAIARGLIAPNLGSIEIYGSDLSPEPAKPAPPLRCAVLAWDGWNWQAIFANGDETAAKAAAAEWLEQNPNKECQLMIAQPEGRAKLITKVEWGK